MKNYRAEYDIVKSIGNPQTRGTAFEGLINKIFADCDALITKSYRTTDTQQEIDGAILIYSRIFLLEVKWENNATLAASKLFSFLGKINSKIEGTLGVFISHEELKENFIDSVRNGLRQNCIIIHGKKNIEDIVDGYVNLKEYVEYCFIQASTKNRVFVDTSEFKSIPVKEKNKDPNELEEDWLLIYNGLVGLMTLTDFSAKLEIKYSAELNLSEKIVNIYNTIAFNNSINKKYNKLIEKLIEKEKNVLTSIITEKLKSENWKSFSYESFLNEFKPYKLKFNKKDRIEIIENVTQVLNGDWEEENKASRIIDFFYDQLTQDEKLLLATKYIDIYCDNMRADYRDQKKLSKKIFSDLGTKYFTDVKDSIINAIKEFTVDENLNKDLDDDDESVKKNVIHRVKRKYSKIFTDNEVDANEFIKEEYDKL